MQFLMNSTIKTIVFWPVILVSATLLWQVVRSGDSRTQRAPEISYSQFLSEVDAGNVIKIRILNLEARGTHRDGSAFRVNVPSSQEQMLQTLRQKNVEIWYADTNSGSINWLANLAPLLLLAALWFFMIRQMRTKAHTQVLNAPVSSNAPRQST
jgi:cell division protease FtsH